MSELTITLQKEINILKEKNSKLYYRVKNLTRNKLRLKKTISSQQKLIQNLSKPENIEETQLIKTKETTSEITSEITSETKETQTRQQLDEWEDVNDLLLNNI